MDTTIKKVDARNAPTGPQGEQHLVTGKAMGMRLWREEPGAPETSTRDYETVGFVIQGKAELTIAGQSVTLESGDSWLVPRGTEHAYRILEPFLAVEATSPPAHVGGRDR